MLSIRATYDGKRLRLAQKVEVKKDEEVIVVFLNRDTVTEPEISATQIRELMHQSGSLSFLEREEEDIYTDKDLKVKY